MCGIAGIIRKRGTASVTVQQLVTMSGSLTHRGPDDEGFVFGNHDGVTCYFGKNHAGSGNHPLPYSPLKPVSDAPQDFVFGFAHRRLSIIDLTAGGHQPMCDPTQQYWITFNGEVYNYIELREELRSLGHQFISESDTEVVLTAYKRWGINCVSRFNGMWAFCIYDGPAQTCFASRDRFGVKPFYYANTQQTFVFGSEQKAFVAAGITPARANAGALADYIVNVQLEQRPANFFESITELWPGHNLSLDMRTGNVEVNRYYHLSEHINLSNEGLSEKALTEVINYKLEEAVKLRLRSDVEVGACLSGGIDSSVLCGYINKLNQQPLHCFTSVFRQTGINEEAFADAMALTAGAIHKKTQPSAEGFLEQLNALVYALDAPIWDTSTYAQFKVMELAAQNHIKVVLDGQGADELFGGYHHHFIAKWNNLLSRGKFAAAMSDIGKSGISIPSPYLFFAKQKVKQWLGAGNAHLKFILKDDFINSIVASPIRYYNDINQQQLDDIYESRLKSFLRCEDRCGMWHSVESRTPFSDDPLLFELMFSFNPNRKIKNGVSKHLLREAGKNLIPEIIYRRYDKKGFETPMQDWMKLLHKQMLDEIRAARFDFVKAENLQRCNPDDAKQNKLLFRLFILARWQHVFSGAVAI